MKVVKSLLKSLLPTVSSATFALTFLLIDLWVFFFRVKTEKLAIGNVGHITQQLNGELALFFTKYLFSLYLLALIFGKLEKFFQKKRLFFYVSFYLYTFAFLQIRNPQIFDPLEVNNLLPLDRSSLGFEFFAGLSIAFFIFLTFLATKGTKWSFSKALVLILLAMFLSSNFLLLKPEVRRWTPSQGSHIQRKGQDYFIFLIDSMAHDSEDRILTSASDPLKKFISNSKSYTNVIANIPQTHTSLSSFFSGQKTLESQVRYAFHDSSRHPLIFPKIDELKKQGYELHILNDVMETSNLTEGASIESISGVRISPLNLFMGRAFASLFLTTFFNNSIGRLIMPDTFENISFHYTYDPPQVARKMIQRAEKILRSSEGPKIIFFHVCALHLPAIFSYPYFPEKGDDLHHGSHFSYPSARILISSSKEELDSRGDFHLKVYNKGIELITKEFLNPFFDFLTTSNLVENSNIVLMSDHGENLWSDNQSFPKFQTPYHGDVLLYSARAEKIYLRVQKKSETKPGVESRNYNISQVWSHLLTNSEFSTDDSNFAFSETGINPFFEFRGHFKLTTFGMISNFIQLDGRVLYFDPSIAEAIVPVKQRSAYWNQFRLTLFPTFYGFRSFLCDLQSDRLCRHDLSIKLPELSAKMLTNLLKFNQSDEKNGLAVLPLSLLGQRSLVDEIRLMIESKNEWLQYMGFTMAYYRLHAFQFARNGLINLFRKTQNEKIKNQIHREIDELCSDNNFSIEDIESITKIQRVEGSASFLDKGDKTKKCFEASTRVQNPAKFLIERNPAGITEDLELFLREGKIKNYFMKRRRYSPGTKTESIYFALKSLPKEQQKPIIDKALADLDQRFEFEKSYQISGELSMYYFAKFILLYVLDPQMATQRILSELKEFQAGSDFENLFFKYVQSIRNKTLLKDDTHFLKDYRSEYLKIL